MYNFGKLAGNRAQSLVGFGCWCWWWKGLYFFTKFQNKEIKLNFKDLLPIHASYIGIIASDFYIKQWEVANVPNLRE